MISRIHLSSNEKRALRAASAAPNNFIQEPIIDLPHELFNSVLQSLKEKGMAYGYMGDHKGSSGLYLSDYGKSYLDRYPRLRNPIKWKELAWWAGAVLAILLALRDVVCWLCTVR